MSPRIKLRRIEGFDPDIELPVYATSGAAGADIRANLAPAERVTGLTLAAGGRALVSTGFSMEIPQGFEVQIRPRSGLALKQGLTVANAPGTIDSDYRGPVGVILINLGASPVTIHHGDRIAQMIVATIVQAGFVAVDELEETARGGGGFGSTGVA